MREIKYRAWLIRENKMVSVVVLEIANEQIKYQYEHDGLITSGREFLKNVVLEQYTGLKDENGEEIYEGDIVKISESNWWQSHKIIKEKYNAVVFFNERTQEIQFKEVGGRYRIDYHYFLQDNETKLYFEVIGNIHENPELLKGNE